MWKNSGYTGIQTERDIGLVVLEEPLDFTAPEVGPVCLTNISVQGGEMCYTTGWGETAGK